MLNIVTVQVGNYCGRGKEYVEAFLSGCDRHLSAPARYYCLTDEPGNLPNGIEPLPAEPGVSGWWNKISLFKPGMFEAGKRILFSDLDAVVIGDLTDIASYRGKFAAIRDFYNHTHIQSALMAWEAGALDSIWHAWDSGGRPQFDARGDQAFIEAMQPEADYWQDMLPGQVVSFKDCRRLGGIMPNARMICFHGQPRPHEANDNFYLPIKPKEFA
jgi:hypothetical protein